MNLCQLQVPETIYFLLYIMNQDDFLTPFKKILSNYNAIDLLAVVAALQIMPQNASRAVRLETLAQIVVSIPQDDTKPNITTHKLKNLLNSYPMTNSPIQFAEDPCDNLFTEAFAFHGGSYTVFPGITENPSFILRHLAEALLRLPNPINDELFLNDVNSIIASVLAISNEIAKRADLTRGIEPDTRLRRPVNIPNSNLMEINKKAITFSKAELMELLYYNGGHPDTIKQLVIQQGQSNYDELNLQNGDLFAAPIVHHQDKYVVAIPGMLMVAARHQIIKLAIERNLLEQVASKYADRVWFSVVDYFKHLGNKQIALPPPKQTDLDYYRDGLFELDTDKIIYAGLLIDPLTNYDLKNPFDHWKANNLGEKLSARWQDIEEKILTSVLPTNDWLNIFLYFGVGRSFLIPFKARIPKSQPTRLSLSVSDLETVSFLEHGNNLILWKYAEASRKLKEKTLIRAWGFLDEFEIYRKNGYTYYLSDDKTPTVLGVMPGGAGALRREVANKQDYHAVPSYQDGSIAEVVTLHNTKEVPIYITKKTIDGEEFAFLIEGLPLPIWINNSNVGNTFKGEMYSNYFLFMDMISHWFWQFTPMLVEPLSTIASSYNKIIIELYLNPDEDWFYNKVNSSSPPLQIITNKSTGVLQVNLGAGITDQFAEAENSGEREFMRQILAGFRSFLSEENQAKLSDESIDQVIEAYMPLGLKKKFLIIDSGNSPELMNEGLPKYREIEAPDVEELLDDLGYYLRTQENLGLGKLPDQQRTHILQKVVNYFYTQFQRLVDTLNPEGLLEWLITQHEAGIAEKAHYQLTIPTRLACFSSEPEILKELTERLPELVASTRANRFLIEYVTARPPVGLRPISFTVFDKLMAFASQIIEFAFESDLIHFNLADFKYHMLQSGRFGADRNKFSKAMNAFSPVYSTYELVRTKKGFKRYWKNDENVEEVSDDFAKLEAATKAEFGYSIKDINTLMGEAYNICIEEINPSFGILTLPVLVEKLHKRLNWSKNQIEEIVDLLSLKERKDFLKPPTPFRKEDVYPWRYNRLLSYLRCPFLQRKHGNEIEILWGPRNIADAWRYLTHLCMQGRLQAKSLEMRQFLGVINNERGAGFNMRVADFFRENSQLIVKEQVIKIAGKRISNQKGDLGDIDVLVTDAKRRRILVIECKDLALARTPYEMSSEITNLFLGADNKDSIVEKHTKRVEWIKNNLKDVIDSLGIANNGKWKVEGIIVVDEPMLTPYLYKSKMRVVSFDELSKVI